MFIAKFGVALIMLSSLWGASTTGFYVGIQPACFFQISEEWQWW